MKNRFFFLTFLALFAAFSLSSCDKISSRLSRTKTPVEEQREETVEPAETAQAEATPTPAEVPQPPAPEPTINKNASVIILCYHRFEKNPRPGDALAITPEAFEAQLEALKNAGFTIIGLQDYLAFRRGEKAIPDKSAIITIDDGYESGYSVAWPILKKYDYPFTMFIYTNYVNVGGKSLTWNQLAEMRDAGVDIQSHTVSHASLRDKKGSSKAVAAEIQKLGWEGFLRKEIEQSKQILESKLGILVNTLAYPYGHSSPEARRILSEAGYEAGLTVQGSRVGFDTPHDLIGRYDVGSMNPKNFQAALNMIGGGAVADTPSTPQVDAAALETQPASGATLSDSKPLISANLASLGEIEPGSVTMRVSGIGPVPVQYDEASKVASYQPTKPLRPGPHTVFVRAKVKGKMVESSWSFNVAP